jgi:hypothetical protein
MSMKHRDISSQPWSNYTKADYTPEQWHSACLIHQHDGAPTSKDQCKLPVKTPNGVLNRNGVHAAAAALAGARGGVHASPAEKAKAAGALLRYYRDLGEDAPASLLQHSDDSYILEHYGVKGMHWGIRRDLDERGEKKPLSRKAKVGIGLGLAAVTAVGVVATAKVISSSGNTNVSALRDQHAALMRAKSRVDEIMNSSRALESHLARSHPDAVLKMAQQRAANLTR